MMEIVIITGLSGSGKTKASDWFEDGGYYFIDNLPPKLINNFLQLINTSDTKTNKVALAIDIRGGVFFGDLIYSIDTLRQDPSYDLKILFIEASPTALVRRYSETRRNHPLASDGVTEEVIEQEIAALRDLRNRADYIIDTSEMKVADLKKEIVNLFVHKHEKIAFCINILSFGYKHGIPLESDLVFDVRFMANPFYISSMKHLTGKDKEVSDFVLKQEVTQEFVRKIDDVINYLIPFYEKEGKFHLNLSIGCTGGQHRSVAIAIDLERIFKEQGKRTTLNHSNLEGIK